VKYVVEYVFSTMPLYTWLDTVVAEESVLPMLVVPRWGR
jgi:hypothetical protein